MAHMRRPKGVVPTTADLAFIRQSIKEINEVRALRRYADQHVTTLRKAIVKRVVDALWRRYQFYRKSAGTDPQAFEGWLVNCQGLHNTYQPRYSYATRLYWVYRVVTTAMVPELRLFDEAEETGVWYFRLFNELLKKRFAEDGGGVEAVLWYYTVDSIEGQVPGVMFVSDSSPGVVITTAKRKGQAM